MIKKLSVVAAAILFSIPAYAEYQKFNKITQGIETIVIDVPNTYKDISIIRTKVPGGWLIFEYSGSGNFFYPDPNYEWMPEASQDSQNLSILDKWKNDLKQKKQDQVDSEEK